MQDKAIALSAASLPIRLAVMVYELLLVAAVLMISALPFVLLARDAQTGWLHTLFQVYLLAMLFLYFSAFWLRSGQTLAMKTWRVRLVSLSGDRLSLKQAALRFAFAWLGLLAAGLGFVWALFDRDRQFLHDRLAGTRLIRVARPA